MEIVFDAHFDVLMDILHFRRQGERRVFETRHLPNLKSVGVNALICSIFVDDAYIPEMALRHALNQIAALREDIADSPDFFEVCLDAGQARRAVEDGKVAIFLSLEGAEPLGSDILLLRTFYDLGVRLLGLTWSRRNYLADGSAFSWNDAPARPGGLTKLGREAVAKARELGMVVDVSHLNDAGFEDVAGMLKKPFIASHSNSRALCGSARNLTDAQIKAIAASGGVIGINCYSPFVAEDAGERTAENLLAHLDYIGGLAGFDHVGMGLDICDCLESAALAQPRKTHEKDVFENHAAADKFFSVIRARYPESTSAKILGGNFIRVLEEVLG